MNYNTAPELGQGGLQPQQIDQLRQQLQDTQRFIYFHQSQIQSPKRDVGLNIQLSRAGDSSLGLSYARAVSPVCQSRAQPPEQEEPERQQHSYLVTSRLKSLEEQVSQL